MMNSNKFIYLKEFTDVLEMDPVEWESNVIFQLDKDLIDSLLEVSDFNVN